MDLALGQPSGCGVQQSGRFERLSFCMFMLQDSRICIIAMLEDTMFISTQSRPISTSLTVCFSTLTALSSSKHYLKKMLIECAFKLWCVGDGLRLADHVFSTFPGKLMHTYGAVKRWASTALFSRLQPNILYTAV